MLHTNDCLTVMLFKIGIVYPCILRQTLTSLLNAVVDDSRPLKTIVEVSRIDALHQSGVHSYRKG